MRTVRAGVRSFSELKLTRKLGVVLIGALALSSCNPTFGAYRGATTQGKDIFSLYQGFWYTAIGVAIVTFGALLFVVIKFRRKNDAIPVQRHSNVPIEVIYTVIPAVIVAVLFFFTVKVENRVTAV